LKLLDCQLKSDLWLRERPRAYIVERTIVSILDMDFHDGEQWKLTMAHGVAPVYVRELE